ncbi:MAG: M57 family metalloprotease [Ignavibacterium album]|uniref:M57 family metalloprotease n=1 Tax=Ignavibacterium album TaxID=591197 RepID=UPI0026E9B799|nr:M57 family metalloprotease [Ignavibacterium album]MCX8105229.1 M57 family metalloprotease [Ignavibacterium album]
MLTKYLSTVLLIIIIFLEGCDFNNIPVSNETNPDIEKIKNLGFREDMIKEYKEFYLVGGCIKILKEDLKNNRLYHYSTPGQPPVNRNLITNVTVRVDQSIPLSGPDNWRNEVISAINYWNSINETLINFVYTTSSTADITISSDYELLDNYTIAAATFPTIDKRPGVLIQINLDYNNNENVSSGQKIYNMVHELGHCIGFRHTNWLSRGEAEMNAIHITGTPLGQDPNSVMNGGTASYTWNGFSNYDIKAAQYLYTPYYEVLGMSDITQGSGITICDLNYNNRPEIILMTLDAPTGPNNFRYKIGWDMDPYGTVSYWQNYIQLPLSFNFGDEAQGGSITAAKINNNNLIDLIFMSLDNPVGNNNFRYVIAYDINTNGFPSYYSSNYVQITGMGSEAQGAGVAVGYINNNILPDLILMSLDNPPGANNIRYKIGWDLNSSGIASSWSNYIQIDGMGNDADGAGISLYNLDSDPRPEIVLMVIDDPQHTNEFRYKIGWNLDNNGNPSYWSSVVYKAGVGHDQEYGGIAIYDVDGNMKPEMILMGQDAPNGPNTFRYRIAWNLINGNPTSWDYNTSAPEIIASE